MSNGDKVSELSYVPSERNVELADVELRESTPYMGDSVRDKVQRDEDETGTTDGR